MLPVQTLTTESFASLAQQYGTARTFEDSSLVTSLLSREVSPFCLDETSFSNLKQLPGETSGDDAVVTFLEDAEGRQYVLKQIKLDSLDEQISLIKEYVVAKVGKAAHIPIAKTYMIPKEWQNSAKPYKDKAAILQIKVPGKILRELKDGGVISIHQKNYSKYTKEMWETRFGVLSPSEKGLTRSVLQSMIQHEDLIKLVAFDTFINNSDRSAPNVIYDDKEDRYYGIDHFSAFSNRSLAAHALRQISDYKAPLTSKEKEGLVTYLEVLKTLHKHFTPEKISSEIDKMLALHFPEYEKNEDAKDRVQFYKKMIAENYEDVRKLIQLLEKMI